MEALQSTELKSSSVKPAEAQEYAEHSGTLGRKGGKRGSNVKGDSVQLAYIGHAGGGEGEGFTIAGGNP